MIDWPSAVLSGTLSAYWSGVVLFAVVNLWRYRRLAGIWPRDRVERIMWPFWVPLIALWIALPWLALRRGHSWLGLAANAHSLPGLQALRLVATLLGFGCFVATVVCWSRMGKNWSVAVVPGQKTELVRNGPYAVVRHPIYALSIALMICSVVVIPTLPMLALAMLHLPFVRIKARNEERYLRAVHGGVYTNYCRRTGRFFPRMRAAS